MKNYFIEINGKHVKEFQAKNERSAKIQTSKFYAEKYSGHCYFVRLYEILESGFPFQIGAFSTISYNWV